MNKKLKLRNSIWIISVLDIATVPPLCKGFGKKPVSCNCLATMMRQPYHDIENIKHLFKSMANDIWNIDVENSKLLHKIADYLGQFCTTTSLTCPMFHFDVSRSDSVFRITLCWRSLCIMLSLSWLEAQCIKKMINNRHQCTFYWNKVEEQMEYLCKNLKQNKLCSWSNYFPKEFIIVLEEIIKARQLIEKKLNGRITSLTVQSHTELD